MNHLLYLRINLDHPRVKIRMIPHQHVRIPRRGDEQRVYTATYWRHEDLADLQPDEEGEGHDDGGEGAAVIVGRFGEFEVEVGEEGAEVGYEC